MAIKWAVIGATGMMGVRAAPEIMASNACQLVAIHGFSDYKVRSWSEKWGVPGYTSVVEMLDKVACDVVYIASPQDVHLDHVRLCAERGRHVLCEKPLARTAEEAGKMVEACRRAGVKLGTAFNLRFHDLHRKAKELITEGVLGKVVSARCQYGQNYPPDPSAFRQVPERAGGGSMIDMGNHAMDLVEFVTGKRFNSAMAVTQNGVHRYGVEDACGALLEFEDGGFAFVDSYYCVPLYILRNDLEINCSRGILYTVNTLRGMVTAGKLVVLGEDFKEEYEFDGPSMYQAEFEAFASAVMEDTEPPCDGWDGLHSQYLLDAIYASARLGKKMEIPKDSRSGKR